jgi:hypothetical protein
MSEIVTSKSAAAAVALRLAGASYSEIAEALGFDSEARARQAVEKDLAARAADADPEKRELLRAQSSARLERLLRGVWTKATNPNDPEHLPAVSKALSIIDRHTRLYGLDAPTEVTVHTPTASEIEAWLTEAMSHTSAEWTSEPDVIVIEGEIISE